MTRLQNDRSALFLVTAVLGVLVVLGLYTVGYSRREMARLAGTPAFASPEAGMVRWHRDHGASRVEITHTGQEYPLLEDLWSVRAEVWSDDHEGSETVTRSFVRTPRGWLLVPEGHHAGVIALGRAVLP